LALLPEAPAPIIPPQIESFGRPLREAARDAEARS